MGKAQPYPQVHSPDARRSGSRGLFVWIVDQLPLSGVAGQAPRAVEDGEMAVGVFVDPDLGLDGSSFLINASHAS